MDAVTELYDHIVDEKLLNRRLNLTATSVPDAASTKKEEPVEQLGFFTASSARQAKKEQKEADLARKKKRQLVMLDIKEK